MGGSYTARQGLRQNGKGHGKKAAIVSADSAGPKGTAKRATGERGRFDWPKVCVQKLKKYAYEVERSNQASGTRIVTRKESAKAFVYRA